MALQKLNMCNASHQKDFEYCCIKEGKVFCHKCWKQTGHVRHCSSSRCGYYKKLAHQVINRALQLKNSYYLRKMSSNYDKYEIFRAKFLTLNYEITQIFKAWIQQKLPLYSWAVMNEMLHTKYTQLQSINCNKYDAICSQMLKTIKDNDFSKKSDYLQQVVSNFHTINHQIDGNINFLKTNPDEIRKNSIQKDQKIEDILEHVGKNIGQLLNTLKTNFKGIFQTQFGKFIKNFDQSITWKGVCFHRLAETAANFKRRQKFPHMNLNTQFFSTVNNEQTDLYNGFNLSVPQLQSCPEQILQISKQFLKERLYNMHSSIESYKSSFPYKYAYVMSTTLEPDQEYELLTLQLQKSCIKSIQPKTLSPFLNSSKIAVMGPDIIIITFMKHPEFSYSMKIYNWKRQRQPYYQKLKDIILEMKQLKDSKYNQTIKIQFTSQVSPTSLAYINFRLVYDELFIIDTQERIYEGEKVTSARGMQLFQQVMQKWKSFAKVQLNFNLPAKSLTHLFA